MKNEYDANQSGVTSYAHKPVIKRSIPLCDRFKAIKLISVFKLVGCSVMMLMVLKLTIELIGTLR